MAFTVFNGIPLYSMIPPNCAACTCTPCGTAEPRDPFFYTRNAPLKGMLGTSRLSHQHNFAHRVHWRVHSWKHSVEEIQEPTRRTCPSCVVAALASSSLKFDRGIHQSQALQEIFLVHGANLVRAICLRLGPCPHFSSTCAHANHVKRCKVYELHI